MATQDGMLTAADLDAMSPDQRQAAFEARIVTDLDSLPEDFRAQVATTADRLGQERSGTRQA